MLSKIALVSAAAGGLLLVQPQTASAGVDVDVNIGSYPYYPVQYEGDYQSYPSYRHDYDDDDDYDYDRISCWEGRRIVRRAGFRGVHTIKCYGEVYRYRAWRRGHQWRVSVDSDTGRIIRARPVDYY
jgi:hypothetical protein